jgi:hypothetical protein
MLPIIAAESSPVRRKRAAKGSVAAMCETVKGIEVHPALSLKSPLKDLKPRIAGAFS